MGYDIFINGVKADERDFEVMDFDISHCKKRFLAKMQGKRIDYFID